MVYVQDSCQAEEGIDPADVGLDSLVWGLAGHAGHDSGRLPDDWGRSREDGWTFVFLWKRKEDGKQKAERGHRCVKEYRDVTSSYVKEGRRVESHGTLAA